VRVKPAALAELLINAEAVARRVGDVTCGSLDAVGRCVDFNQSGLADWLQCKLTAKMLALFPLKLGRYPEQPLGANFPPMIEAFCGINLIGRPSEQASPQNPEVMPDSYHADGAGQSPYNQ
jgi:hypothetical protein